MKTPKTSIVPAVLKTPAVTAVQVVKPGKAIDPKVQANAFREFKAFGVEFTPETEAFILRGKSGQFRLMDKADIAVCLANKMSKIPIGENGTFDRKAFSKLRKAFKKLDGQIKLEWEEKAQAVFSPARKEYHDIVHGRVATAVKDKRFSLERYQFQVTKQGIVHVASRLTHRPV